ncbi:MAG: O-antigen ligase family protein [Bacilli bacterium]|nr:O-antigen ligase family protein [Bacilli bacterium]
MKTNKISYPLLIIDFFVFALLGLCIGFLGVRSMGPVVHTDSPILFAVATPVFICLLIGFILYVLMDYKYNHLKLKNIFLYFAIVIAISNIIAVASLPSEVILPNGAEPLIITPLTRVYYLMSGFAFGLMSYLCFYLIPRKIFNRRYMDIILMLVLVASFLMIFLSFIVEWDSYAHMFSQHFIDIEPYALKSICGQKNIFGRMLLYGVFATILLRIKRKNAKWLLLNIPLCLFLLLTFSKMAIILALLTLLIYFIVRVVMLCKKNKDNLIITLSIVGFIAILSPIFIVSLIYSESGIMYEVRRLFIKFGESANATFNSRILIWQSAFKLLAPHQYIFGFGIDTFGYALHNTYAMVAPEWENLDFIYNGHNLFVDLIGRGGIILLGVYLFLHVYVIYVALKLRKKTPFLSLATIVLLIMYLCYGITDASCLCGADDSVMTNLVIVFPIMSEYFILLDADEIKAKKEIVDASKKIKKVNFASKILNLNKKRLIFEAKYIAYDLNNKVKF